MNRSIVETMIGFFVVAFSLYLGVYASKFSGKTSGHYNLIAKFEKVDGINVGSDIRMSGIKIGVVSNEKLDTQNYMARLDLSIYDGIKIPKDSSAQIVSEGFIGGKYLTIVPGGEDEYLQENEEIKFTQSSINFETLIGKFMFDKAAGDKKAQEKPAQ